jgi:predicted ATPase
MLSRIKITNFKSFAEAEIRLRPLTVMIGANASGKTNFIEALGLLGWMAKGRQLSEIYSAVRDGELALRGSLQRLTQHGNTQPIGFTVDIDVGVDEVAQLELDVSLDAKHPEIALERFTSPAGTVMYEATSSISNAQHVARFGTEQVGIESDKPVFTHALPSDLAHEQIALLEIWLKSIFVFRPVPNAMRGYANFSDWHFLRPDGSNVSAVVDNLCQSSYRDRILEFIRTLPEQNIRDIGFIRVPGREDLMIKLLESFGESEHWHEAVVLSDGTLRTLAIAAALFNSDSLLIIEDLDDGVHPSRLGRMLELIRAHAEYANIRVLVTSHNPALLDALPASELRHVVACYRDPEQGDSRLIELGQLNEFPALVAQGRLGQLLTRGIVDHALKHDRTDEQRAADALEWLAELEASE